MKSVIWKVLVILVFFALIIIHLSDFVFISGSDYSDIPITHYPNTIHIKRSLEENHQIPLWTNLIYSGTPFAANPLSGLWYLPGWIAFPFSQPFGINLSLLFHLIFGVVGFYKFLRLNNRTSAAALFGGLSFFAGVKIIAHFGAGHLTFLYAISWTPWLLYFTLLKNKNNRWSMFVLPGICLGMIISADPRWVVPAGLLWFFYVFYLNHNSIQMLKKEIGDSIKLIIINTIVALGISAAVWLPLVEFIRFSTRSSMSIKDNLNYSLTFDKLFGLIFPDFSGFSEWVIYPSMLVLFLSILVVFLYKNNHKERIWIWIFLISFLLSLGGALPFVSLMFQLPFINLLRVPARFFFVSLFSLSILASFGFDYLMSKTRSYKFDRLFFLAPVLAFISIFFIGFSFLTNEIKFNFVWAQIFSVFVFLLIGLALHNKISGIILGIAMFSLLFIDVGGVNYFSLEFRPKDEVIPKNAEITLLIDIEKPFRIYSPSYAITQEVAAYYEINQINGIDPMQLKSYVDFFIGAAGVPDRGYSVTLPPFTDGDPNSVNDSYCPNVSLMEKLSVKYIISDFPMDKCLELEFKGFQEEKNVYEINPEWAWIKTASGEEVIEEDNLVFLSYSPNRIKVNIKQQGMVTISEIYYPGWKVIVNEKEQKVFQDGIFRSIYLPEQNNEIDMIFRPATVFVGLGIEVFTWSLIITLMKWKMK
ncbi:MAG: hypothetical protein CL609_19565 [Anaerolineaceae bacterium]|nr:hypothetical protein [Anaerolineaceae bacterium]